MGRITRDGRGARSRLIALAVGLALVLGGCSATPLSPQAESTPTAPAHARPVPTTTVAPVPVPVQPVLDEEMLALVNGFVARPDVLELRGDGVVLTTLSYMSSPANAIAVLSAVFGEPPVDEAYQGTNHAPPGVFHRWDDFVLDERLYDEQRRVDDGLDYLVWPRFAVYFDGPASGDMPMSSSEGIQAGDSWEFASSRPGFDSDLYTCIGTVVDVIDVPVPDGSTAQAAVVAVESDEGTVRWVAAPEMVVDGCA